MLLNVKFDIDGVLLNWSIWFREYCRMMGYKVVDTGHWEFRIEPAVSESKQFDMIEDSMRYPDFQKPTAGARDFLTKLYKKSGQPIEMITHRPISVATETHQAIYKGVASKIMYSIAFVSDPDAKRFFLNDVDCFVDDKPETCFTLARMGKTVFCPLYNYNEMDIKMNSHGIPVTHIEKVFLPVRIPRADGNGGIIFYDHFGQLMNDDIISCFFTK